MKKISIKKALLLEACMVVLVICINILVCAGVGGLVMIGNYIDVPSIVLMLLIIVPGLLISGMGKDFVNAFSIGSKKYNLKELKRCLEAVQLVQKLVLCAAGISSMIAFVTILKTLDEVSTIGPNMAVAILVFFYMVILELLLLPLKANTQNAITEYMALEDEEA